MNGDNPHLMMQTAFPDPRLTVLSVVVPGVTIVPVSVWKF